MPVPPFDQVAVFDPELYLLFYSGVLDPVRAAAECEFVLTHLSLPAGSQVLDLACGHGRHAIQIAVRGHRVTGIDRSEAFLARARAAALAAGIEADFRQGDMRAISFEPRFDAAIMLFTAFGYFSDAENAQVIARIAAALRPGGRLMIESMNRDNLARRFSATSVEERAGSLMIDRRTFDARSGRVITARTYLHQGRRVDAPFFVRLYTCTELEGLLDAHGLEVEQVFGGFDGAQFGLESPRMIVVARKRS